MDRDAIVANAPRRDDHEELNIYDIERIVTEFGFEKNGMRFPSHVEIKKTRSTVFPGAKHSSFREVTLRTVNQDYSRFQFFSVRSREEILNFVNGFGPLPAIPGRYVAPIPGETTTDSPDESKVFNFRGDDFQLSIKFATPAANNKRTILQALKNAFEQVKAEQTPD